MVETNIDPQKFQTFIEINTLINSYYADPRALLLRILESATRLTGAEASSLLLVQPETRSLHFEIALGPKGAEVKQFSLERGQGIAGWVAERNRSLIVNDVSRDERFHSQISASIEFETRSILAVPMRMQERCVGVLEMINKQDGGAFTEEDRHWLEIFATQAALAIQNAKSFQAVRDQIDVLQDQMNGVRGYHTMIAASRLMQERLELVARIAETDSSVLIHGESGVGKELIAEQIHQRSARRNGPLVRVNCAALPEPLLESELFGHVKGAFTDADRNRTGRFELADGGTIFLDEIGDLPPALQAKMLRVIQERSFEKVGSSTPVRVNVRILAATNKDIAKAVEQGEFRSDLYYRLNVLPIEVPPLRRRREDIPALAEFFLKRFKQETKKQVQGFTDEAMETLLSYSWPGNVRELENVVERAVVICDKSYISPDELALDRRGARRGGEYEDKSLKESVTLFKKHFIRNALERHGWHQTETAKALGIQRTYLSRLIKELEIK